MSIHVFVGPTLQREDVERLCPDACVHEPVACGDVYRIGRQRPRGIAIIDGYFDHRLSVWHKEILWALSLGIPVYGAGSMGALRAAELAAFGMRGVGAVFAQYRDGVIEDDDEVAVVHEEREHGYRSRSHALVNIRATLAAAQRAGAVTEGDAGEVLRVAKATFYADRTFQLALRSARLHPERREELEAWWLRQGLVDQKRTDAIELLVTMSRDAESGESPTVPIFHFETTNFWRVLRERVDASFADADECAPPPRQAEPVRSREPSEGASEVGRGFVERLKQQDPRFCAEVLALASERALALVLAGTGGELVDAALIQDESERFRRERGLLSPSETSRWLEQNDLDVQEFSRYARDEVVSRQYLRRSQQLVLEQVPDVLRRLGRYSSS